MYSNGSKCENINAKLSAPIGTNIRLVVNDNAVRSTYLYCHRRRPISEY